MAKHKTRFDYLWTALESIMKKIYAKRPKRYDPVRICNPQELHTARLHPRQGISVVLDRPSKITHVSEDAQFEVSVNSRYLFLESVENNHKGQIVYTIAQKYDLTNWAEISEVYIGEVRIDLVNNTHENANECKYVGSTIGVYHCSKGPDVADKVLTVINPESCGVKIEPHRILEVVCYESDWEEAFCDEDWSAKIEDFEVETEGIFLEQIKRGWFTTRLQGNDKSKLAGFTVLPRYCPNVNSLLEEKERATWEGELDRKKTPGRQMHFWFGFTEKSIKNINALKNGKYTTARISITGKAKNRSGEPVTTSREFLVILNKHGKPVSLTGGSMFNRMTALTHIPAFNGTKREFDRHRSLLTNPGQTEQLDFCSGFEDCIVEIASPKTFWDEEPADASWTLEREPGSASEKALTITPLPQVEKFGTTFQRFKVERTSGESGSGTGSGFLGAIKIVYPAKTHLGNGSRRISLWMNWKKKASDIYSGSTGGTRSYTTCGPTHYKNGLGTYEHPKLATVKIEEIAVVKLADGEKTKKLKDVHTYSSSEWEDYYYGIPVHQQVKKKEYTQPHVLGTPPIAAHSTTGGQTGKKVVGSKDTTIPTSITPNGGDATKPIVVQNPANRQEITLLPDQELIIRLMPPEHVLTKQEERDKCRGELWSVNPMAVADIKPVVIRHSITPTSSDRYRQEIIVKADTQKLPQNKGTHCMGAIRLECSATNRVVRIYVKKDLSTDDEPYALPKIDWVTNDLPKHNANDRNYILAQDWKHGQGIILNPKDFLYVREPIMEDDGWKGVDWSVRFVQHVIPHKLWEKMTNDVRDIVDRQRPWYSKDYPVFMNKTLMFRSLEQSAAATLPKMIAEIARLTPFRAENWFPVASLVFEATQQKQEEDKNGINVFTVTLRREFHLCVQLPEKPPALAVNPPKSRFIPIYYPVNEAVVRVNRGDTLAFYLKPKPVEPAGHYMWNVISWPTFLTESSGYQRVSNDDCYKFRVDGTGDKYIRFKCDKDIVNIRVVAS